MPGVDDHINNWPDIAVCVFDHIEAQAPLNPEQLV